MMFWQGWLILFGVALCFFVVNYLILNVLPLRRHKAVVNEARKYQASTKNLKRLVSLLLLELFVLTLGYFSAAYVTSFNSTLALEGDTGAMRTYWDDAAPLRYTCSSLDRVVRYHGFTFRAWPGQFSMFPDVMPTETALYDRNWELQARYSNSEDYFKDKRDRDFMKEFWLNEDETLIKAKNAKEIAPQDVSVLRSVSQMFLRVEHEYSIPVVLVKRIVDEADSWIPLAFGDTQIKELDESLYDKTNDIYYLYSRNSFSRFTAAYRSMYFNQVLLMTIIGFVLLLIVSSSIQNTIDFKQERNRMKLQIKRFDHVTHDLRSPMQVVLARSEKISTKVPPNLREEAERLGEDVEDMAKRLEDLLRFNKLEAHRLQPVKEVFRLGGITLDMADRYIFLAEEKGVEIITDGVSMEAYVKADENMIRSAIQNYLTNAIKHTPEGGTIRLTLDEGKKRIRLTVENTGKILSKKEQRIIWRPYQQANATRDNAQSGVGLGLTFVKMFIELHNGRYGCYATDDSMAFWFELPVATGGLGRFVNSSGQELPVYADSELTQRIGMLYRNSSCFCMETTDGQVVVLYEVSSKGVFKVGFTNYVQGVQLDGGLSANRTFINTSGRKLPVYADSILRTKIGTLDRNASCVCSLKQDAAVVVLYEVSSSGVFMVGFTDYMKGVQPAGDNVNADEKKEPDPSDV